MYVVFTVMCVCVLPDVRRIHCDVCVCVCCQLYVVVTDNGIVRRSSFIRVRVTVVRNRNGPVFSQARYNVTVDETVGVTQSLIRVTASDADGVSGCVVWSGGVCVCGCGCGVGVLECVGERVSVGGRVGEWVGVCRWVGVLECVGGRVSVGGRVGEWRGWVGVGGWVWVGGCVRGWFRVGGRVGGYGCG